MLYADVIVDLSLQKLDKTFQYAIPSDLEEKIRAGSCVRIPFGNGGRRTTGYVVDISSEPKVDPARIKPLDGVVRGSIPANERMIALAAWMRRTYGCTMNAALKTVLPVRQKEAEKKERTVVLRGTEEEAKDALAQMRSRARHSQAKAALLETMIEKKSGSWDEITRGLGFESQLIRELEQAGILAVETSRTFRDPVELLDASWPPVELNEVQKQVFSRFAEDWDSQKHGVYLLHGVTGSGKTEVYMEMMEKVIRSGRQVIVLIPEIALTPQTVTRFSSRFPGRISIINSRMTAAERFDQFERAKSGAIDVMIGPRSALFTPFPDLGLIIVDEEHETSYKSEITPRYHARETAVEYARLSDASVVLGSATPSLESFSRAQSGEYTLLSLPSRATNRPLPECVVVDLRKELAEGNRSVFSRRLQEEISARLERKEQVMLFINRRGLAGFVNCRACGHVLKCPHCDVSLTLHNDGQMHCHYCGYTEPSPKTCPNCGSVYIGAMRAGTQRFEEMAQKMFPQARVLRMDMDTTRGKHGHQQVLEAFARHEADILIGTQMIVKGHDFPGVTLVGILAADLSLNSSDFRCAERTFDLLVQAAGRAGRGQTPGTVIIQTYRPEHYAVTAAAAQDYEAFYRQEIAYRRLLNYPPAWHMLSVLVTSSDETHALQCAQQAAEAIRRKYPQERNLVVLGPMDAAVAKVRDQYKKAVYLRSPSYGLLTDCKEAMDEVLLPQLPWDTQIWYDFDPVSMF